MYDSERLANYFKNEFEMYPKEFRDISDYVLKEHNYKLITDKRACGICSHCGEKTLLTSSSFKHGIRFYFVCNKGHQTLPQRSDYLAYWQALADKKLRSNMQVNLDSPLVKSRVFNAKLKKINKLDAMSQVRYLVNLNASLSVVKKAKHSNKGSVYYGSLTAGEQDFVNATLFALVVFKNSIADLIKHMIGRIEEIGDLNRLYMELAIKDRLRFMEKIHQIDPSFESKIKNRFSVGVAGV
jgi:hypothetical protein